MANPKVRKAVQMWIEALRSGMYAQTKGRLFNKDTGAYCCLGVACDLYNQTHDDYVVFARGAQMGLNFDKWVVQEWLGLRTWAGTYEDTCLMALNDTGRSFSEIADLIESRPKGLFVEDAS